MGRSTKKGPYIDEKVLKKIDKFTRKMFKSYPPD